MTIKLIEETPPWEWPRNAASIIKKTMLDRKASPADRLTAAELAGNMVAINDDLAHTLLDLAENSDESEQLRAKAAVSLGPVLEQTDEDGFEFEFDEPAVSEETFHEIQDRLQTLYSDAKAPKLVRRRALEASVRAQQEWHSEAIRSAYSGGDPEWILTAVFAMIFVHGFNDQILESLHNPDPDIHRHAVEAAGAWDVEGAWNHIVGLLTNPRTPKDLMLSAIEAAASLRPEEADDVIGPLLKSRDKDIRAAAEEAIELAGSGFPDDEDEDD